MAAAETAIYYRLSADDFETASIRSAAPSYISEAPSYHSTIPPNESTPAYTPATVPHYSTINRSAPTVNTSSSTTAITTNNNNNNNTTTTSTTATPPPPHQPRSLLPPLPPSSSTPSMISTFTPGAGLPRLPSPRRATAAAPSLSQFRMPTAWSSSSYRGHNNPQARHYHSVASRRAAAAAANSSNNGSGGGGPAMEDTLRSVLARANMSSSSSVLAGEDMGRGRAAAARMRPLEDPYLVGEEAAARARRERLARENGPGDEVLINENRRWDWFLAQMKDYEERDRGWTSFRRGVEGGNGNGNRRKLARRFGR
ncbi:hypothetical protein F4809DRAFT_180707 [Biscogniauxia mediterranea]|nr:hypothetical protein F4809DRAFT_180707 [Biscogniauxia mediterranea]